MKILRWFGRALQWVSLLALAGAVLCFILVWTPLGLRWGRALEAGTPPAMLAPADAIVVLGGDRGRAIDAARLFHQGLAPAVIISGGIRHGRPVLDLCGVPESKIIEDAFAATTADHPRTLLRIPIVEKGARLIVVTSQFHQFRARRVFEKAGFTRVQYHSNTAPGPARHGACLGIKHGAQVLYEWLAIAKYFLMGAI